MDVDYQKMLTPQKKNFEAGRAQKFDSVDKDLPQGKKNFSTAYVPIDNDPDAQYIGTKLRLIPQTSFVIKKKSKKLTSKRLNIETEKQKIQYQMK